MSLNNIKLDFTLAAAWYVDALIADETEQQALAAPPEPLPLLGNFERKILILVRDPDHAFLGDEDLSFLTGILSACKMSLADVGILNLHTLPNLTADRIQSAIAPSAWWLFGIDSPSIGLPAMSDTARTYSHQNNPLFWAPDLRQLANNPLAKRTLWGLLKKQYGS